MRIHDISQPLGTRTATWPGDRAVEIAWTMHMDRGDAVNVAALTTSAHAGTHIDGFLHVTRDGETAARMPLDAYVGRCIVVDVAGVGEVSVNEVADIDLHAAQRVLFRTRATVDAGTFPDRFAHIAPDLARQLASAGVRLVGTDAPSVDPVDSKTLDVHHVFAAGRVAILENVVLTDVEPGEYTLIALPLRLVESDSSPVRAVLIEGDIAPGSGGDAVQGHGKGDVAQRGGPGPGASGDAAEMAGRRQ
ncbi:MAG: cyclase family protein [Gemmatimonadetes bacterium]|nr:cyclase family protein [Gemmatimonadota bacterium]